MAGAGDTLGRSRLRRVARRPAQAAEPAWESCDLCAEPIPPEHPHLFDVERRELRCACRACATLFDRGAAAQGQLRRVPDRRLLLEGLSLDDETWAALAVPVEMAWFVRSSQAGRVLAFYPSPMGATESQLELGAWAELERDSAALRSLESDVEALLVNRARGARQHFVVPIDDAYRLVALIRTRWRGLSGGSEVWGRSSASSRRSPRARGGCRGATRRDRRRRAPRPPERSEMAKIKLGRRDTKPDAPAHTPGIRQGNEPGGYLKQKGHLEDGSSTAARSTGINAEKRNPIDPRMPNLSPG